MVKLNKYGYCQDVSVGMVKGSYCYDCSHQPCICDRIKKYRKTSPVNPDRCDVCGHLFADSDERSYALKNKVYQVGDTFVVGRDNAFICKWCRQGNDGSLQSTL